MTAVVIHHTTFDDLLIAREIVGSQPTIWYGVYRTARRSDDMIDTHVVVSLRFVSSGVIHTYSPFFERDRHHVQDTDARVAATKLLGDKGERVMEDVVAELKRRGIPFAGGIPDLGHIQPVVGEPFVAKHDLEKVQAQS